MHTFVELFRAKDEWLDLPVAERETFLSDVASRMAVLDELGAEVIGWGSSEPIDRDAGYPFFAVWRMPSTAVAERFAQELEAAGWYAYFQQINTTGELQSPPEVLARLAQLGR
ncbi:DUF6616 family protein [Streptomyces sp. NPDC088755]|uniref:DUF6616 family protein n=1 Tax=Streptomyces sp. NPDC088755 TaxID=3365888 RepID=UPI003818D7AD